LKSIKVRIDVKARAFNREDKESRRNGENLIAGWRQEEAKYKMYTEEDLGEKVRKPSTR